MSTLFFAFFLQLAAKMQKSIERLRFKERIKFGSQRLNITDFFTLNSVK